MTAGAPAKTLDARRQVISFVLDPDLMGFELDYIEQVVEVFEFSFIPRAPQFVKGALSYHGKVVTVVDTRSFMEMGPRDLTLDSKVLILDHEVYHVGLLVDRVERIESVPVRGPLVQTPEPGDANPYVSKMVNLGGRILNLIDVEKLLVEIETYFA